VKHLIALALLSASVAFASDTDLGAPIPDNARKVAELRYRSPSNWEYTLKWYSRNLPTTSFPRKGIINQPGIKAIHIADPSGKRRWSGLNIYEANGEVRISIVPAGKNGKRSKKK